MLSLLYPKVLPECKLQVILILSLLSATESLDTKINNPGEDLIKSENKESGNTEGIDDQEIKDSTDDSDTCLGTHPPFMKTNSKDSSALNECETSSSVIPEPPSSPSLASLPDEEEEFTPSLGLEGDDWVMSFTAI